MEWTRFQEWLKRQCFHSWMIWLSCTSQHSDSDESCRACLSPAPPPACPLITLLWEIEESEDSKGVVETESKSSGKLNSLDMQLEEHQRLTRKFVFLPIVTAEWKLSRLEVFTCFLCFTAFEGCHALMGWESCATPGPVNTLQNSG